MNINELRVGNFVKCDRYPSKSYKIGLYDFATYLQTSPDDYKPIPLTEEWMLKFGFVYKKNDKSNTYTLQNFRFNFVVDGKFKGKTFLSYVNTLSFENVNCRKYVHQLQNLYFALTGEELIIQKKADN